MGKKQFPHPKKKAAVTQILLLGGKKTLHRLLPVAGFFQLDSLVNEIWRGNTRIVIRNFLDWRFGSTQDHVLQAVKMAAEIKSEHKQHEREENQRGLLQLEDPRKSLSSRGWCRANRADR